MKGQSNGDPFYQAVEKVVQDLDLKIKNIIDSQHEVLTASTTGVSPTRVMGLLLFFLLFSFTRKQMSFSWFCCCSVFCFFFFLRLLYRVLSFPNNRAVSFPLHCGFKLAERLTL